MDRSDHRKIEEAGIYLPTWKQQDSTPVSRAKQVRHLLFGSPTALIYDSRLEPNGVPSVEAGSSDVLK
jgi:hypothetical protein